MSNIIVATYGIINLKVFKNKSDAVTNSDKMFCDYIIFFNFIQAGANSFVIQIFTK